MSTCVSLLRRSLPIVAAYSLALIPSSLRADLLSPGDFTSLGTLNLSSGNITIDTDALTISGAADFNGVADNQGGMADSFGGVSGEFGIPEVAVFTFDDISLTEETNVTVTGTRALALLSHGNATIDVLISVSGTSGSMDNPSPDIYPGGPGGFAGGLGANDGVGPGGGGFSAGTTDLTRGASGGFGSEGRIGDALGGTVGAAGPAYGSLISALQGGSGGGGGQGPESNGIFTAGGGGGGGALEVGAADSVTIGTSGVLEANGGAGDWNFDPWTSSEITGGGGSGGGIRVHGSQIDNQGEIRARSLSNGLASPGGGGRVLVSGSSLGTFVVGTPVDTSVQAGVDVSSASASINHGVLTITPQLTVVPGGQVYGFNSGIVAQNGIHHAAADRPVHSRLAGAQQWPIDGGGGGPHERAFDHATEYARQYYRSGNTHQPRRIARHGQRTGNAGECLRRRDQRDQ